MNIGIGRSNLLFCVGVLTVFALFAAISVARASDDSKTNETRPARPLSAHSIASSYPWLSLVLGEEGATVVGFTIDADGSVKDPHIVKSSGFSRLDAASVEGVKAWRYTPALLNGKPVPVPWTTQINWRIATDSSQYEAMGYAAIRAAPDDFPEGSYRRGEAGVTFIGLRVSQTGLVLGAEVYHGSGHEDLDAAAVRLALSRVKVTAGEINGKPVITMVPLIVIWNH